MARKFEPGRVAQHGFEYQKFAFYYLISLFNRTYDNYYYEGKEDLHFESKNDKKSLFVQVKTSKLSNEEKKKVLIKWLSLDKIADKYLLICEKYNSFDLDSIADEAIEIIKKAKNESPLSNSKIAYEKYLTNNIFDENRIRLDIEKIKNNSLKTLILSSEDIFDDLRNQMKMAADNSFVIDSTLEERIYFMLDNILLKIHKQYVSSGGTAYPVTVTYEDYINYYTEARSKYPLDYFNGDYVALKKSNSASILIDENLREVKQIRKVNIPNSFIVTQLINEIFYKEFRNFYIERNLNSEIETVEEIAYQNYCLVKYEAFAKGDASPSNIYFGTLKKDIDSPLIKKMNGAPFCRYGCYIYLTSDDANTNVQISREYTEE